MEKEQKVHIGGIKFSEELVHVTLTCGPEDQSSINELLHAIAEKQINIPFLCHSLYTTTPETIFCIPSGDQGRIRDILESSSFSGNQAHFIDSVGTLTLFPHRNELTTLGRIIRFFGSCDFPLYSFSTSISAIAFNTSYHLLDKIARELQSTFILPENHAPFRQGFRVTQIQV